MSTGGLTDGEVRIALELAGGHLEEAENVLWDAARRADSEELSEEIEDLTRELWRIEHAVDDLREEIELAPEPDRARPDA